MLSNKIVEWSKKVQNERWTQLLESHGLQDQMRIWEHPKDKIDSSFIDKGPYLINLSDPIWKTSSNLFKAWSTDDMAIMNSLVIRHWIILFAFTLWWMNYMKGEDFLKIHWEQMIGLAILMEKIGMKGKSWIMESVTNGNEWP